VEQLIGLFMTAVLWIIAALLWLVGSAFSRQLTDEFKAWTPRLTAWLKQRAVRKLPEGQRERCAEEWGSHINDTPGEVGKIYIALGLLLAPSRMSNPVATSEPSDEPARNDTSLGVPTGPTGAASFAGSGSFGVPTGPASAASFAGSGSFGVPTGPAGAVSFAAVGSFRVPIGPTGTASGSGGAPLL
jgi:hypothetical protein